MKNIIYYLMIVTFCFAANVLNAHEKLTAKQIQEKSINVTRVAGTEAVATMKIIDRKGRERIRKIAQITKLYDNGETEKKLIRFLSPADVKGTGFLTFDYKNRDDDKWLYLPALRKTRRIVSSENAKSFMGSEFSYADITPPTVEDFNYRILGEKDVNGLTCWEIEIVPLDEDIADENGFSKKVSFIAKSDFVIRGAVYYDLDGELLKEMTVDGIKEVDTTNHKYRLIRLRMENKQNNRKSILNIEKIQYNPNVKNEYFTTRYLARE